MLVIEEANRWNWDQVFENINGKLPNRKVSTPATNGGGIFYANELKNRDKSFEEKQPKAIEKKDYEPQQQMARSPPLISNNNNINYLENIYDRQGMGYDAMKRAQQGKNMLIPQ